MSNSYSSISGKNNREKTRKIAVAGLMAALCLVLSLTPLGYIPIGSMALTIIHIPVIIAVLLEGPIVGLALGLVFGVTSLVRAYTAPTTVFSIAFQNPLVSVLPRLIVPLAAYGAYKLVDRLSLKINFLRGMLADGAAALIGTLTNTALVLLAVYVFYGDTVAQLMAADLQASKQTIGLVLLGIGVSNGIPEMIGAVAITVPVMRALRAALYRAPSAKPTK